MIIASDCSTLLISRKRLHFSRKCIASEIAFSRKVP
jgi:hypothetical protein